MKTNEIKKGMRIKSVQLGAPTTGIKMDNMRGNRRLVDVKGSEVGLFDEMGSIYAHDIVAVETENGWAEVEHTPSQLELKQYVGDFF